MPKAKTGRAYVSGKSIKQLTRIHAATINKMDEATLRAVVTRLSSAANKRIQRIEEKGITTPATREAERGGGRFSAKGKNLNQLRSEYKRVKSFLKSETSTLKGYKDFAKRFEEKLQEVRSKARKPRKRTPKEPPIIPPEPIEPGSDAEYEPMEPGEDEAQHYFDKYEKVFRTVERLQELNPWIAEKSSLKSPIVSMAEEYIQNNPNISIDSAVQTLNEHVRGWYEKTQEHDKNNRWSNAF